MTERKLPEKTKKQLLDELKDEVLNKVIKGVNRTDIARYVRSQTGADLGSSNKWVKTVIAEAGGE